MVLSLPAPCRGQGRSSKERGTCKGGLDQLGKLLKLSWEEHLPGIVGVALGKVRPCLVPQDPWGQRHIWVGSGDESPGPLQCKRRYWRERRGGKCWSEKATGGCLSVRNGAFALGGLFFAAVEGP